MTRPCPDSDALRLAFTRTDHRMQRKSDGTVVIEGRRFEIPNRYRHLTRLEVRYAGWDLGLVHLVDERTGTVLSRLYPQDKTQNASGLRRTLAPVAAPARRRRARDRPPAAARQDARPAGRHRTAAGLSAQGRGRRDTVNKKMLALYGLKWNPFAPDVPVEALHVTRRIELFCWRVQQLVGEGGFALVTGAPGTGKSVTLRILAERLARSATSRSASSRARRPASPTSIARWAICSASSWLRTTAGPEPRCCVIAGRPTSTPLCRDRC